MASRITTSDGVGLHVESAGSGETIVFVHEFAGDHRSWEPQLRHFSRTHRVVTYAARGYLPSDVPEDPSVYSQARACDDIRDVLDGLGIERAHIVGLSMGGFATLQFGITHPDRALSLTIAGCGYGAERDKREQFRAEIDATVARIREQGMDAFAASYGHGPTRLQFQAKDPRGFAEFEARLAEHSATGSANTMLGVQRARPSLFDLTGQMAGITTPTLVVTGDEDFPCLLPGLLMKQTIPTAALVVMPNAGHTINIEDPQAFNAIVGDFIATVTAGRWPTRDPRVAAGTILGVEDR